MPLFSNWLQIDSGYLNQLITSGLVLHLDAGTTTSYPGTGSMWYDLSTSNKTGTLVNNPTYSSTGGGCINFSSSSSQAGRVPDLGTIPRYTVNTWFKIKNNPTSGTLTAIFTNTYNITPINFTIGYINNSTTISGGFYSSSRWYATSGMTPVLNRWYNVCISYDNTTLKMYVDGTLFSSLATTATASSSGLGYDIGKRWDYSEYLDGSISMISVYNRVLSDTEILQNYNQIKTRYF